MKTTRGYLYKVHIGIMKKEMETTIWGLGFMQQKT